MSLFAFLTRSRDRHIAQMAREIASQAQPSVWDQVRQRIFDMNLAEARGYVRARSAAVVRVHTDATLFELRVSDSELRGDLLEEVGQRVVQRVLSDLIAGSSTSRRAAA